DGIANRLGQSLHRFELSEREFHLTHLDERPVNLESEVDRDVGLRAPFWRVLKRDDRLLEPRDGLVGRTSGGGAFARPAAVRHRLLPELAAQGVVGEALDLLVEPSSM